MSEPKKQERCAARQANRRAPDFECRLPSVPGHKVHMDPRTGARWAAGGQPSGVPHGGYTKKYANPKLQRHAASRGRSK